MLCHYWYFKVAVYTFDPHVCIGFHDVIMYWKTVYVLKNNAILNLKGIVYRCILWRISKNEAVNILNNSVLEDNGAL